MQVPFIKYIEALIIAKKPLEDILTAIKELNVPLSDLFELDHLGVIYSELVASNPDYFKNSKTLPSLDWLRTLGVEKMVAYLLKLDVPGGTLGLKGAFEILKDKHMYMVMSSLSLAHVNDQDIELIVNGKYNIHYDEFDIKEFIRYFFNVEGWTLSDKKAYLNLVTDEKTLRYYKYALDGDKNYLIWKLGIAPDVSFDQMLRDMSVDCYYNFKEKSPFSSDEAQKWGQLALKLVDKLEKLDEETSEKKSLFDDVTFTLSARLKKEKDSEDPLERTSKRPIKHLKDLDKEDVV